MSEPRRPRPTPGGAAGALPGRTVPPVPGPLTRVEVQPSQVVAAAGTAVVTAARVGALLTRTGWRIARRMPVASTVVDALERETRRLRQPAAPPVRHPPTGEERRAVAYVTDASAGPDPLRGAMAELLERSVGASRDDGREYLFGTIISQLVPDEARIVAALAGGRRFAACDVVERHRRGPDRTVLAGASAVGRQAGLVSPENTPTYLSRLHGFGLVEFGPSAEGMDADYDILAADPAVRAAREGGSRRSGLRHLRRTTLLLTPLGQQFWTATNPAPPVR